MSVLYYEETVKLRTNDFDNEDHIKPSAILDFFQDIAGKHADLLGLGYNELYASGYYWILLRTNFDVIKQPKLFDELIIATWPHEKGRIDFEREYEIRNKAGEVLITGISKWVIVDTTTRKIGRTDKIIYNGQHRPKECNRYDIAKKVEFDNFEQAKFDFAYVVLNADIDHNQHMNNAKYADMVYNSLEDNKNIISFRIEHINECRLKEKVKVYKVIEGNNVYNVAYLDEKKVFVSQVKVGE